MTAAGATLQSEPSTTVGTAWHRRLPDLVCAGFRLREPRLSDVEHLARAFGAEAASRLGLAWPATSDHWTRFVAKARAGRAVGHTACFVIVLRGTPDICGLVLLQRLAPGSGVTTLSLAYAGVAWQTDLPARSLSCALSFAFKTVGVRRVEGRTDQARELELVGRLGAVTEGVLRGSHPVGCGLADQTLWSVLETEWDGRGRGAALEPAGSEDATPLPDALSPASTAGHPAWTHRLPVLSSAMVSLREVDLDDASVLLEDLDPIDVEIAIEPPPKTVDEFRRYIAWARAQRTAGRAAAFVIVPGGTRRAAGLVQVRLDDSFGATAEWGIVLATRYRGTGAALEATQLMAGFAFETLGVQRLETRASGIDPRSIGLIRKIGAVREAHLRRSFVCGNEVLDADLWAILRREWRGTHAAADRRTAHTYLPLVIEPATC